MWSNYNIRPSYNSQRCRNILSLMKSIDFAMMWSYNNVNESYYVSLRSCDKVDVSKIAKAY